MEPRIAFRLVVHTMRVYGLRTSREINISTSDPVDINDANADTIAKDGSITSALPGFEIGVTIRSLLAAWD